MAFLDHGAREIYLSIFWGFSKTEGVPLLRGGATFFGEARLPYALRGASGRLIWCLVWILRFGFPF